MAAVTVSVHYCDKAGLVYRLGYNQPNLGMRGRSEQIGRYHRYVKIHNAIPL